MKRLSILLITLIFTLSLCSVSYADAELVKRKDVQEFISMMVSKHHFKKQYLEKLFLQVKLRPQVIRSVKKPLEKEAWHLYQMLFVSKWRIENGVVFWKKYAKVLERAEKTYGIPASIIVATIGIETKYGMHTGQFRVMDSLSSLGFSDSPRAPFFRNELIEFLLLVRDEHLEPLKIMGSYAGAIGQPQFMPSSYRHYAVNFSKSGKTDLMHDEIDVIGSIANYYKKHGWDTHQPIAMRASIIGERYHYLKKKNRIPADITAKDVIKYGIIPRDKQLVDNKVKIIELKSLYAKEYWLGFHNFDVIKRYNSSDLYAMAVYQLSNFIVEHKKRTEHV